ncbi:MAG: hypothetical protein RMZ42_05700 [Nostoc sp. DedQUE05]|uniref:hypothetical protein n=1 Tax=Nostoc sp. DedQUE05 TaxID=3075391 RepID=UPI002AD20A18|nr:hypothetical protein [Nostoc sp. DedQUE05]MDZ8091421.1 hypothetical protein [Nostoc sp. DedQUE05]
MTTINQVSFKSTCNRKVIVEELIDGELKGIVGGISIVLDFSSQINATSTDGNDAVVQDSNQDIVNTKTKQRTRTRRRFTLINGVGQTIDSTVTSAI